MQPSIGIEYVDGIGMKLEAKYGRPSTVYIVENA